MTHIRRNRGERFQHKAALLHGRMRNREAGIVDNQIAKQENVDVDDARPFLLRSASAHPLLDVENAGEQFLRRLLRIQRDSTIQEPRLGGKFHGFGFVERRDLNDFTDGAQPVDGGIQIFGSIPDVRAERKIDREFAPKPVYVNELESQIMASVFPLVRSSTDLIHHHCHHE